MLQLRATAAAILAFMALNASATPPETPSAYDIGVKAYRARDYATARSEWRKAASAGDLSAMNNLGYLLSEGLGGSEDDATAIQLWITAATRGHPEAAVHLGSAHETGTGVTKSHVQAYAWYVCSLAATRTAAPFERLDADMLAYVNGALSRLTDALPPDQLTAAKALAKQYVDDYATR